MSAFPAEADIDGVLADLKQGKRIAVWQTPVDGLDWLSDLVAKQQALLLATNGYPCVYVGQGRHLLPPIVAGPPSANPHWLFDPGDVLSMKWEGKTVIDQAEAAGSGPEEWLMVEAWDES